MSGESEKLELTALNVFDVLKKCKKLRKQRVISQQICIQAVQGIRRLF